MKLGIWKIIFKGFVFKGVAREKAGSSLKKKREVCPACIMRKIGCFDLGNILGMLSCTAVKGDSLWPAHISSWKSMCVSCPNHTGYSGRAEKRKQSIWEGTGSHYLRHLSFADKWFLMIETTLNGGKNSRGYHEEIINFKQQNYQGGTWWCWPEYTYYFISQFE